MRYGVFIPLLLVGFGLTFTPFFGRIWEWVAAAIGAASLLVWVYYVSHVLTLPPEYGYVGIILITAFTYTLLRLRFLLVVLLTVIGISVLTVTQINTRITGANNDSAEAALLAQSAIEMAEVNLATNSL